MKYYVVIEHNSAQPPPRYWVHVSAHDAELAEWCYLGFRAKHLAHKLIRRIERDRKTNKIIFDGVMEA